MTTYYTQLTTRGHELRTYLDDRFVRIATPEEVAASDAAAERDGGRGLFEADIAPLGARDVDWHDREKDSETDAAEYERLGG